jgi:hypothetical protein
MKLTRLFVPLASGAAALSMILIPAGGAYASVPNANYGFDGNANLVVGGGSTTLYKVVQGLATLYDDTASCATNNSNYNAASLSGATAYPQSSPAFNQCAPATQTYSGTSAGGNYDGDTVTVAAADGSSTGIASLNGDHSGTAGTFAYEGTNASIATSGDPNGVTYGSTTLSNGFGTVDFGFSSRAAKTSGGNCTGTNPTTGAAGDELQCDTFWGVAADGVEVFTWGDASGTTNLGSSSGLTASDLYGIYTCAYTTWGSLPDYNSSVMPPAAAPIVPWSMNSTSGTYADFDNYVSANDGSNGTLTVDQDAGTYTGGTSTTGPQPATGKCVRELASSAQPFPLENDVKPILTDVQTNQGGLDYSDVDSTNNPQNWIWFGSFGLLNAYSYLSSPSLFGEQFFTEPVPLGGTLPSTSLILAGTYPAERILSLVTLKTDADCPIVSGKCNLSGGPTNDNGTTDLNVTGGTSGKSGAVREFIRFVCRNKAENTYNTTSSAPIDPYTGISDYTEIGATISSSGFTLIPSSLRSTGSNCDVISKG